MRSRIIIVTFILLLFSSIYGQDRRGFLSIDKQIIPNEFFLNYLNKQSDTILICKDKQELQGQLDKYILYRLKILEAEKLSLDTTSVFIKEYQDYKSALTSELLDYDQITEETISGFYKHYTSDVKISHLQINLDPLPLPSDTLKAFNKIWEIYKLLHKGMAFETAAKQYSENPITRQQDGLIGYIGAATVTYPIEEITYKTSPGEYSKPVRTWQGYHIIKVHDVRESRGSVLVAQIRKSIPHGAEDSLISKLKRQMDSLLFLLQNGANFNKLATEESDHESAEEGGVMPWIRTGTMDEEFTDIAFSLKNDGDISPVFRTKEGFHIIKRLRVEPVPSYEQMKPELINSLKSNTSRSRYLKENLIGRIRVISNCLENEESVKQFFSYASTSFNKGYWKEPKGTDLNRILFTYGSDTIRQKDFSDWLSLDRYPYRVRDYDIRIRQYYRDYLENKLMNFAEKFPEKVFPELNKEFLLFREDKLLELLQKQKIFEFSENIEEKLPACFERNKDNYKKENSLEYKSFNEAFEEVLKDYYAETNEIWEKELKAKYDVKINKKAFKTFIIKREIIISL